MQIQRKAAAVLIAVALISSSLESASAHTQLSKSYPMAGSIVRAWPAQVSITFNEPLLVISGKEINWIKVLDSRGQRADVGKSMVNGSTVLVPVKKFPLPGIFKVLYRVVASDGHSVSNSFNFTYKPSKTK